jgi:hypothetical protein
LFCLFVVWFYLSFVFAAELKTPTNINITTSGNNVTVTWTLPGESETYTYLDFYSSGRREKHEYIKTPQSSYTITLTSCKKYRLNMQCIYPNNRRSKMVEKTFWVTGKWNYYNTWIWRNTCISSLLTFRCTVFIVSVTTKIYILR